MEFPVIPDLDAIPTGDMPGDKVQITQGHVDKAQSIFPRLWELLQPLLADDGRAVVAVHGGSGVGKSEIGSLLAVVHVLHADQVHVMFRARLDQPVFGAGDESLEVMLCDEAGIPWPDIAFRSVDYALRRYLEDRSAGVERHHFTAIDLRPPVHR